MTDQEWKLLDRFKEPSSWSALAAGLAAIGIVVPGEIVQAVALLGSGVCVLLGVVLREAPAKPAPQEPPK